ncbi:MAG: fatty acid desaturase [Geminicoccales bacterium]
MGTLSTPALSIEQRSLRGLRARSDRKGLIQLRGHAGALLATGATIWLARGTPWILPALVLHGVVLVFLFAPLHEAIHRTAFRSRRLNDGVAWICGGLLVLPPRYFRAFHFAHHRHTQDAARDPELMSPKPATLFAYLRHLSGWPYWRERIGTTLRHACGRVEEPFIAAQQRPGIVREARLVLAQYACVAVASLVLQSGLALWLWLLPALLGQPFLRAYLLAEHTGCPLVPDMLENSRTTLTTRLIRWLAWNMPYHAEHHAHPAIPFHALPAAHVVLKERIAIQAPGYVSVNREILLGLRDAA